jgi:2-polyprenyl-6-methoxyphenol hydroxylase-like FAD-dependent oxidoreductase
MTRPFLESHVRRRALALPSISMRSGTTVTDLTTSEQHRRVSGVYVLEAGGSREAIDADLVVDATGRGTQAPRWLEFMGYQRPPETAMRIDLAYATRTFRRLTNQPTIGHIIIGTPPILRRGGFCFAVEDNRWQVTLVGFLGEEPPTDAQGFADYARSLPNAEIAEVVGSCEPLDDIRLYKFASNLRRHYERLTAFPEGYLVIGDALCSFNPAYGQGMTVAALEVEALEACLAAGTSPTQIAPQFFKRAAQVIDVPWRLTTGEDFRFPQVEGKRPPLLNLLNAYVTRVHHAATVDPVVCRAFFEVASLTRRPERLLTPEILWRVMTARPALST